MRSCHQIISYWPKNIKVAQEATVKWIWDHGLWTKIRITPDTRLLGQNQGGDCGDGPFWML